MILQQNLQPVQVKNKVHVMSCLCPGPISVQSVYHRLVQLRYSKSIPGCLHAGVPRRVRDFMYDEL